MATRQGNQSSCPGQPGGPTAPTETVASVFGAGACALLAAVAVLALAAAICCRRWRWASSHAAARELHGSANDLGGWRWRVHVLSSAFVFLAGGGAACVASAIMFWKHPLDVYVETAVITGGAGFDAPLLRVVELLGMAFSCAGCLGLTVHLLAAGMSSGSSGSQTSLLWHPVAGVPPGATPAARERHSTGTSSEAGTDDSFLVPPPQLSTYGAHLTPGGGVVKTSRDDESGAASEGGPADDGRPSVSEESDGGRTSSCTDGDSLTLLRRPKPRSEIVRCLERQAPSVWVASGLGAVVLAANIVAIWLWLDTFNAETLYAVTPVGGLFVISLLWHAMATPIARIKCCVTAWDAEDGHADSLLPSPVPRTRVLSQQSRRKKGRPRASICMCRGGRARSGRSADAVAAAARWILVGVVLAMAGEFVSARFGNECYSATSSDPPVLCFDSAACPLPRTFDDQTLYHTCLGVSYLLMLRGFALLSADVVE